VPAESRATFVGITGTPLSNGCGLTLNFIHILRTPLWDKLDPANHPWVDVVTKTDATSNTKMWKQFLDQAIKTPQDKMNNLMDKEEIQQLVQMVATVFREFVISRSPEFSRDPWGGEIKVINAENCAIPTNYF